MVKNLPTVQRTWVQSLRQEDPLEEERAAHTSILAWETAQTGKPAGFRPWGCKELDMTERLSTHTRKDGRYSQIYVVK